MFLALRQQDVQDKPDTQAVRRIFYAGANGKAR